MRRGHYHAQSAVDSREDPLDSFMSVSVNVTMLHNTNTIQNLERRYVEYTAVMKIVQSSDNTANRSLTLI